MQKIEDDIGGKRRVYWFLQGAMNRLTRFCEHGWYVRYEAVVTQSPSNSKSS